MERIIHFTVPQKLTPVQAKTIERARALHPGWEIKVWQDPVQPDGYLLEKYWPKVNSGAQLADLLRLDILYRWGGIYVDGDLLLLKPLDDLAATFDFFIGSDDGKELINALIGARSSHPAIWALIEELLSNQPDWSLSPARTTGPEFFADVLKWKKDITVLPRETFYSYDWNETHSRKNHRHSYGEHLWKFSWSAQADQIVKPIHSVGWRSTAKRTVKSAAKRIFKPALAAGFRIWHRIKSVDRLATKTLVPEQPKFYAVSRELVIQTIHGFNIIVDGSDTSLTPELIFGGCYEPPEENFVKRIVRGGDWALDVGANVGSFSMLAGQRVGSFGRVFSYEPNPRTMQLLCKSTVMNWMHERIVLRPVAVGEVAGNVRLTFTPERLGDAQVGHDDVVSTTLGETIRALGGKNSEVIDVPSVTLDEEFPVDLPIKLLKIDVEGQEGAVLKGARRLLEKRCVDFILVEVQREVAGSRWIETLTQLKALAESNYVPCTLERDGSLVEHKSVPAALERLDRVQRHNLVLMARDQYTFKV